MLHVRARGSHVVLDAVQHLALLDNKVAKVLENVVYLQPAERAGRAAAAGERGGI